MSPTYEPRRRFLREYRRLSRERREEFRGARRKFVTALREKPPEFPGELRVKRVQGHPGIWELSFGDGGHATFSYDEEVRKGETHVIWRRIGDHGIFNDP